MEKKNTQTSLFEINTDAIPDISSIFGDPQKAEPEAQTRKNGAGGGGNDQTPLEVQELTTTVRVKKTISRHRMRRILSEANLEKELPWHFNVGETYHCLSWGDVDSLTYFRVIVKQQHIKYALISTWCMAMEDLKEMDEWISRGYVDRIDLYCGEIFRGTYGAEYEAAIELEKKHGGRLCIFRNHSKIMVLLGERFDAVIESSANVNTNPRTEQSVITIDSDLAAWYKEIFDGVISFDRTFDDVKPYSE